MSRSKMRRVLSAQVAHETNTFSIIPTTLADYRKRQYLVGTEIAPALTGTKTEIAGHLTAAERYGWTLVQPVAAAATPSGKAIGRESCRERVCPYVQIEGGAVSGKNT